MKLDLARARAHWHLRAGLASPIAGAADEVIARTGWLRTLGGVDVYLSARARAPGLRRAELEALVEAGRLRVVPAVRGCIYLVPAVHVPLALRVASDTWRKTADKDLAQLGKTWKEVEALAVDVAKVLAEGAMPTDRVRKALPAGPGMVPMALRHLELEQRVERTLEGGRLDTERYLWRLARGSKGAKAPAAPGAALAQIFVGAAGPTTLADFAWWAGMTQRDGKAAFAQAGLVPVEVDGYAKEAWIVPEDADVLARPAEPSTAVSLLSFEDNYQTPRGSRWLVDPAEWKRPVAQWGSSKLATFGDATHIATRNVIVGGQIAGIWEMDPDAGQVLWATFAPVPRAAREAIDRRATETAQLLAELGHARSFSLDTEDEVRKRAAEVARVASGGTVEKAKAKKKKPDVHRDRPVAAKRKPAARRRRKS